MTYAQSECNFYHEMYDPYEDRTATSGLLAEDLASIYRDVKNGLLTFRRGDRPAELVAIWQWQFDFGSQCGRRLVSALRALHWALFDYRLLSDEAPELPKSCRYSP